MRRTDGPPSRNSDRAPMITDPWFYAAAIPAVSVTCVPIISAR